MKCRSCGRDIQTSAEARARDVFEGMHWECFHFVYEHDGVKPSERCDDPSCPVPKRESR